MHYTESTIEIKADADEVYEAIKDVSRWPEIFPPCQAAKILKAEKNRIEVEMTAITKNKEFKWKSERVYDDEKKIVTFRQYEPAKL
ncbi:type II toxin-antitoxin system RatA family toxin [Ruminiclostridium josui]|uniref:type II toxin-antitoxin system RatA family toxin n=1 Tax=Ruminiclostridium josui TaxID=1499 RepID=UPI0006D0B87F|nr:SRPBCC family protein [Ruminiclostridium josui]